MPDLIFQISLAEFLNEVTRWGANNPNSTNKVDMEELDEYNVFYLSVPGLNKTYFTVVLRTDKTAKLNLVPISTRVSRSAADSINLREIKRLLTDLNSKMEKPNATA